MPMLRLALGLFGICCLPVHADFAAVKKQFEQQTYQTILPELEQLAQSGHQQAQLMLARSYAEGLGREVDINKAYAWSLIAKESGLAEAGALYSEMRAQLSSRREGKQVFTELDQLYGQKALKDLLYPSDQYANPKPAYIVAERLAKPNYPEFFQRSGIAAWAVVLYDINEDGKVENARVALSYPQGGIDQYVLAAVERWTFKPPRNAYGEPLRVTYQIQAFSLDKIVQISRKFERENQTYIDAIKEAADAGAAEYQYKYGLIAHAGLIKQQKALPWYLKAAINGYAQAQVILAQCLFSGSLCDVDHSKGMSWLTKAADAGDPTAAHWLAQQLLNSDNIQFDPEKAANYLQMAANKRYLPAIVDYAELLANSDQPQLRNATKAVQMAQLGQQQDQNNPRLLATLGVAHYEMGDFSQAEHLLQQAVTAADDRNWATNSYQELLSEYQGHIQAAK